MKRQTRDFIYRLGAILFLAVFLILKFTSPVYSQIEKENRMIEGILSRAIGCGIFACTLLYLEVQVFQKSRQGAWKVILPAFLVAINNFPFLPLLQGLVTLTQKNLILLYAIECLMIGVFEELAFRGVLFPILLERYGTSRKNLILVTVLSSLGFGLIHLFNLFQGAGIGATIMQVGYSFLIGGMCAIVFLKSHNLLWSILVHAVYDFCGGVMPTLGHGEIWTTASILWTAFFGIAVGVWFLYVLFHTEVSDNPFLREKKQEEASPKNS